MEHLGATEEQSIALIKSAVDLAKEAISQYKSSISDGKWHFYFEVFFVGFIYTMNFNLL